jgi:hypothetical protein
VEIVDLSFVVRVSPVDTIGKYRAEAIHRLSLPRAHLVGMHLVQDRYFLNRLVAAQRRKSHLGFEIRREPPSLGHLRIPPLAGGTHLNPLSDFLGPPHFPQENLLHLPAIIHDSGGV